MTLSQIIILILLISIVTSITGIELSNNTNFLILLLLGLVALSRANLALTPQCPNSCNNFLTTNNGLLNNIF